MKALNRALAAFICAAILPLGANPASANEGALTRGEAANMLAAAADEYNRSVTVSDILMGDENGDLNLDGAVTRAQGLVMLSRAFGTLPEVKGSNAYLAIPRFDYDDIPNWAQDELAPVLDAGIVAGTQPVYLSGKRIFSPDDAITKEQMQLFISRVYRLFGTNERDDFYQAVNRDFLENTVIPEGKKMVSAARLEDNAEIAYGLIGDIVSSETEKDPRADKVRVLYTNYLNKIQRNEQGHAPLDGIFEAIDRAKTVNDFIYTEVDGWTLSNCLFKFIATPQINDKGENMGSFILMPLLQGDNLSAAMTEESAEMVGDAAKKLFMLCGENEEDAALHAVQAAEFNQELNLGGLSVIGTIMGLVMPNGTGTLDDLKDELPSLDIEALYAKSGLKNRDKLVIPDKTGIIRAAELLTDENLDRIKSYAKLYYILNYAQYMGDELAAAAKITDNNEEIDNSHEAEDFVLKYLSPYLSGLYAERYDDPDDAVRLGAMFEDIIDVYKRRIAISDWLSESARAHLTERLDDLVVRIGGSEAYPSSLDDMELKSYEDGGSLFGNILTLELASLKDLIALEGSSGLEGKKISINPSYSIQAAYIPLQNTIEVTTACLRKPMYSPDYTYEEMLGTIGFIGAHEVAHALDPVSTAFANILSADNDEAPEQFFTEEDINAYRSRRDRIDKFYEGFEAGPGLSSNTLITGRENYADISAMSVIEELADRREGFDYAKMYESYAQLWAAVTTRQYAQMALFTDAHSLNPVRVNRVLQSSDTFFNTFGISEGDGMWVPREERVSFW